MRQTFLNFLKTNSGISKCIFLIPYSVPEKTSVSGKFKNRPRVECKFCENLSVAISFIPEHYLAHGTLLINIHVMTK